MRKWHDEKWKKKHKGRWRMHLEGKLQLPNVEVTNCTNQVVRCRLPSCFVWSRSMCAISSRFSAVEYPNLVVSYDAWT